MDTYYINGDFIEESEATISVNDLSVLRGYGVFDFLRTYNGYPFHLEDHVLRLQRSARLIGLELPRSPAAICDIVKETLARNHHPESQIRIVVTGGISSDGITPSAQATLLVLVNKVSELPENLYHTGVKVITSQVDRFLPGAKSINYIPAIYCQKNARARQAIESIYLDREGYMQEGTTSNLFVVTGNSLITPPCDRILPGITRQVVLKLAEKEFNITERAIHKDEIHLIDELFITSSVKEILPVVMLDEVQINKGAVGESSKKIMAHFNAYTAAYS